MLSAQTSFPDFPVVMLVLTSLVGFAAACLASAHYIKQVFFTSSAKPEGSTPVTEKQLRETIATEVVSRSLVMEKMLAVEKICLTERDYTHEAVHDLKNQIQTQANKVELLNQRVQESIVSTLHELKERFDRHDRALAKMGLRMSQLIGHFSKNPHHDPEDDDESP